MVRVVVVATGGTIASISQPDGSKAAGLTGAELVAGLELPADIDVRVVEAGTVNSSGLGLGHIDGIVDAVERQFRDPEVAGVVVTHGTDTLEETAMLAVLRHRDARPVVFTGAQRSADAPGADGPRNLSDAVRVAASPAARGQGVLIVFAGVIHAAFGTRKVHTNAPEAFRDFDDGAIGSVPSGEPVRFLRRGRLAMWPRVPRPSLGDVRVDTIAVYPGADRVALDAVVAAGANGIVLEALGYGNANVGLVDAVRHHVAAGVPVVLSTRVQAGEVRAVYGGGGGGVDLVAAGATLAGWLRPSQARIVLADLLAAGADAHEIAERFIDPLGVDPSSSDR